MNKIFYTAICKLSLLFVLHSGFIMGQGHETFDNLNASGGTYTASETFFTGNDDITWYHRGTRLIGETSEFSINGITCGFGGVDNSGYPGYVKATVTGGVGEISFNWRSYFTAGDETDRAIKLFVNGSEIEEFVLPAMATVFNETAEINAPGNVLIELKVSGTRQIAIDDIEWTGYTTDDPIITVFPLWLENLNYVEGEGPSQMKSFEISGYNLLPDEGQLSITVDEYFEVSTDGENFSQSEFLNYSDGSLSETTVYARLLAGLSADQYQNEIIIDGGSASAGLPINGEVLPPPPELTDDYFQDFEDFVSAETLPPGWELDDDYPYQGDFGSGTSGGLRGNGTLGFQLTGSAPNNNFSASLKLINKTGQNIEALDISYLGRVARDVEGTPKWTVFVDGVEAEGLEYSTASGEDQLMSDIVSGLFIEDGEDIIIEWYTTSDGTSGTRRQIGVTDVMISVLKVDKPAFNPDEGIFMEPFELEITTETENADIYYKFDENDEWIQYTGLININNTTNVWAQAKKDYYLDSDIAFAEFIIPEGNIVSIETLEDIYVYRNTPFDEIPLPDEVSVTIDDENHTSVALEVNWLEGDYDSEQDGTYLIEGEILLQGSITNTDNLKAEVNVIVIEPIVVVFKLDMSPHPSFDPDSDNVYIRGDMNGWAIPGTDDPNQLMSETDEPLVYSISFILEEGDYFYKYYRNAGTGNPEGGGNRSVTITASDTIYDEWSTVSIYEHDIYATKVYPNPANNYIIIESDYNIKEIALQDLRGYTIFAKQNVKSQYYVLNLPKLSNGVYILKIKTSKGKTAKKVIINN